jgi:hypothetical protein
VETWLIGGPAITRMEANGWMKDTSSRGCGTGTGFHSPTGRRSSASSASCYPMDARCASTDGESAERCALAGWVRN